MTKLLLLILIPMFLLGQNVSSMHSSGTDLCYNASLSNYRSTDQSGTVSTWVKFDSLVNFDKHFSAGHSTGDGWIYFGIYLDVDKYVIRVVIDNPTTLYAYGSTGLQAGVWHHIVVASDGTDYFMWLDGNPETVTNFGSPNGGWFADLTISKIMFGGLIRNTIAPSFHGAMDELRIYSKKLSNSEVTSIYNSGTPKENDVSGLEDYWKFDENTGTTVTNTDGDIAVNFVDPIPTWSTDTPGWDSGDTGDKGFKETPKYKKFPDWR